MSEWIYAIFSRRLETGWIVGVDGRAVIDRADRKVAELIQSQPSFISIVPDVQRGFVAEFIADLMAGWRLGIPIFLGNPQWGSAELAQFSRLTAQVNRRQHRDLIMIPTGGSSGGVKFAMHTWQTLSASVWGFQEFYGVSAINAVCTLPLYHVSGLMQLLRSLLTDGKLFIIDFHQLYHDPNIFIEKVYIEPYFISLVPTQLAKLLDLDSQWLAQFQTILLGGAPPMIKLLTRARNARLPLALTYGMTETASQITSLKPAEFLAGHNSCGRVLPHVNIELMSSGEDFTQRRLDLQAKSIRIKANSLMIGYFPNFNLANYFDPDDLGAFDLDGYLTIFGRNSGKIITGGENVFPIEVVNAIMATGLVLDVWVLGLPDSYWGQVVTAVYVGKNAAVSGEILAQAIGGEISNYKIPKHWVPVPQLPRNSLGKVLAGEIEKMLCAHLNRSIY
ncbi:AMP-binding protein [Chamaesiphon sp. VAR_48_metabat_135_sub]|uniref:AMP-binding protein n=1 Tax=Chamaesiphon sp. VAR_48_metabat_135_sub TaxID=2964699 RepID=UPI00286C094E|nr:AMP-binding protein [Chamaesiphon sp. VAR_48_metabat_135_sub]